MDDGPTDLISPPFDLDGSDANISYSRWFFSDGADQLTVWVSGDGTNWTLVESVGAPGNNNWTSASFRVGAYITPTSTVQVRFRVSDNPNNSITEAGIDIFLVEQVLCSICQPDIGFAGPGTAALSVCGGDLSSGTTADITLSGAPPSIITFAVASFNLNPFPVGTGTLIDPFPALLLQIPTDSSGGWVLPGLPGGAGPLTLYAQVAYLDAGLPGGIGFSNAVQIDFLP